MVALQPRIMIVDDERSNINVLNAILKENYQIKVAMNGPDALQRAHSAPQPDMILLDIQMPHMDGYEVLQQLRANPTTRDIPVIFVTTRGLTEDETRGFSLGAVDYIHKPFSPAIVQARIRTHLALRDAYRHLQEKNELLLYERSIIEDIILKMRDCGPVGDPNIRILVTSVENTTGDLILVARRPDGVQHVLLGDFTGHGLPAAVGSPMVVDIFLEMTEQGAQPQEILAVINRKLHVRLPTYMFMAAVFLEWCAEKKNLCIWNCAMPDVLVLRAGRCVQTFSAKSLSLGISLKIDFQCHYRFQAISGDRMIVSSDGVTETRSTQGQGLFGSERLAKVLATSSMDHLRQQLADFRGSQEQDDDITLVELTCP